jgi:hypothetical protein
VVEPKAQNILDSRSLVAATSSGLNATPVPLKFFVVDWHEVGRMVAAKKVMVSHFAGRPVQAATG